MNEYETFFNIITLPEENQDEAISVWRAISDLLEKSDGCLSTKLHRNRQNQRLLINYAKFKSMDAFKALSATPEFEELSNRLTELGVERTAGTYDVLHSFGEQG